MKIAEVIKKGELILEKFGVDSPDASAEEILSYLLGVDTKSGLYTYGGELSDNLLGKFLRLIHKRSEGYPLQYITNRAYFFDGLFYVDERVLIPRPETEILVESVIKTAGGKVGLSVLDIGAGSGNISLTLAKHLKGVKVLGIDISEGAVEVAEKNRRMLGIDNAEFIKSDLFENVSGEFNIVVSNPPYVKSGDRQFLDREVRCEPETALDGGVDGTYFYGKIAESAPAFLKKGGMVFFEVGSEEAADVKEIVGKKFSDVRIICDLNRLPRVVCGKRKD